MSTSAFHHIEPLLRAAYDRSNTLHERLSPWRFSSHTTSSMCDFSVSEFHRKRLVLWLISSPTSGFLTPHVPPFPQAFSSAPISLPKRLASWPTGTVATFLYKDLSYLRYPPSSTCTKKRLAWGTTCTTSKCLDGRLALRVAFPTDGLQSEQHTSRAVVTAVVFVRSIVPIRDLPSPVTCFASDLLSPRAVSPPGDLPHGPFSPRATFSARISLSSDLHNGRLST